MADPDLLVYGICQAVALVGFGLGYYLGRTHKAPNFRNQNNTPCVCYTKRTRPAGPAYREAAKLAR